MLTYFLQVQLVWLLLYGTYALLLSNETYFRLNRIWLIFSILTGLVLPLIPDFEISSDTPAGIMLQPFVVSATYVRQNFETVSSPDTIATKIGFGIYLLGFSVCLLRFWIGIFTILKLAFFAKKIKQNGYILMEINDLYLPFSFFNWIFINPNLIEKADFGVIMQHENAHVKQRHSIDVILTEFIAMLFWFSPLIWLLRKSLRNVHEYLADAAVLSAKIPPPQYGRILVKQRQQGLSLTLANHFIFSQLKKRLLMMTRNPSTRRALLKYALALPIITVGVTILSAKNAHFISQIVEKQSITTPFLPSENRVVASPNVPKPRPIAPPSVSNVQTDTVPILNVVDEQPEFEGGLSNLFKYLGSQIKYPESAQKGKIEGTVYVGFVVEIDGSISNVAVKRNKSFVTSVDTVMVIDPQTFKTEQKLVTNQREVDATELSDEAVRVVSNMPKWKPGKHKGKLVRTAFTLPIKFKLN